MSDYIASLPKSDQPKTHYPLKTPTNLNKLAESLGFTYLHNDALDKQEGTNEKQLIVAPVAKLNQGMGVFATVHMPYNPEQPKVFGQYKGLRINIKDLDLAAMDTSYYFDDPEDNRSKNYRIDAKNHATWARFVNHSENPNLYAQMKHNRVWFKQLREIQAGDQLFINYGYEYDFSEYDKFYLNTNDNWLSVEDYFTNATHAYKALDLKITPIDLGFDKTTTQISLPKFYGDLLANKAKLDLTNQDWNLPIAGINKGKKLTPKQPYLTLLMLAAFTGKEAMIENILNAKNAKLNINLQQTFTGRTVLYFVLANNCSTDLKIIMLTLLLNQGADPYLTDFEGKNLFHYCADKNNATIFEAVLTHPKIDLKKATTLIECPREECLAHLPKNVDLSGYLLAKKNLPLFKILLNKADTKKIWENLTGLVPSSNHISQMRFISNLLTIKERETLKNYVVEHQLLSPTHPKNRSIMDVLNSGLKQKLEKKISSPTKKTLEIKKAPIESKVKNPVSKPLLTAFNQSESNPPKVQTRSIKKTESIPKTKTQPIGRMKKIQKQSAQPVLPLFNLIATRDKNSDGSNKRKINPTEKMKQLKKKSCF